MLRSHLTLFVKISPLDGNPVCFYEALVLRPNTDSLPTFQVIYKKVVNKTWGSLINLFENAFVSTFFQAVQDVDKKETFQPLEDIVSEKNLPLSSDFLIFLVKVAPSI